MLDLQIQVVSHTNHLNLSFIFAKQSILHLTPYATPCYYLSEVRYLAQWDKLITLPKPKAMHMDIAYVRPVKEAVIKFMNTGGDAE